MSHEPRACALPSNFSRLCTRRFIFAWRTLATSHLLATYTTTSPAYPPSQGPGAAALRTSVQPRQRWCEQQLLSRPGMPARPRAGPMLAARGTVYRHAIIGGTVARITIATRPPRAAPTRHVTIRGCAPGTPGASSLVPRVLSAKTRACGRASVPG